MSDDNTKKTDDSGCLHGMHRWLTWYRPMSTHMTAQFIVDAEEYQACFFCGKNKEKNERNLK